MRVWVAVRVVEEVWLGVLEGVFVAVWVLVAEFVGVCVPELDGVWLGV